MDRIRESHLTPAERAYIKLFKDMKYLLPHREVSVFQQPIETRYDILKTILYRRNDYEYSVIEGRGAEKKVVKKVQIHNLILAGDIVLDSKNPNEASLMRRGYVFRQGESMYMEPGAYDIMNLKPLREFSSFLCSSFLSYFPKLRIPTAEANPIDRDALNTFLRHYRASIDLLLRGPPHAGEHTIDPILAEEWISAQKTPERQRLARRLIENTIYISHTELLKQIKKCVEKTREKLIDGPVTFIVGYPEKSNYYVSLLFYHFWKEAGLPLDSVTIYMHSLLPGNLIDIDEMAYSGTQTTHTLRNVYGSLILKLRKQMIELNSDINEYMKTRNFFPLPLIEYILYKHNVNYYIVRFFCSENGKKELLKMPPKSLSQKHSVKPPFSLIIGREIPSLVSLFGEDDAFRLSYLFGPGGANPASTAYFNHKIADLPSTFLYPLAYGVVPTRILWVNHPNKLNNEYLGESNLSEKEKKGIKNLQIHPEGNEREIELRPFIRYCGPTERKLPNSYNQFVDRPPGDRFEVRNNIKTNAALDQDYRCPYAWYKDIDYETGTYTRAPDIPLPYGPTETNFRGGRAKTRKNKRRVKQKTKSHSK